jgi:hypothetical protein
MKINLPLFLDWGPGYEDEWEGWGWNVAHRILYFGARGRKEVSFSPRKYTGYLFDKMLSALQSSSGWWGAERYVYCSCLERNPRFLAVGPSVDYCGICAVPAVCELGVRPASLLKFLGHSWTHTHARYSVSGWSVRRRGLFRHNTQRKQEANSGIRTRNPRHHVTAP